MDLVRTHQKECTVLKDIIKLQNKYQPNSLAIVYKNKKYSYRELYLFSLSLSNKILAFHKDIRNIGLIIPKSVEYIIAYFASALLNCIITPIDSELTLEEIKKDANYCDVELILCSDTNTYNNTQLENIDTIYFTVSDLQTNSIETCEILENNDIANANDIALLLHTSGSTDNPKRVMLTHNNIIQNALNLNIVSTDRVLICLPMHFGYCNTAQIITHFLLGGTLIILDGIFTPHNFFKTIDNYKVNLFTAVPTILMQLLEFKHFNKYNTDSIRLITFGGAPCSISKIIGIQKIFKNANICETYGLTEAGPRVTCAQNINNKKVKSVGSAIPNVEVKIILKNGSVANVNEIGQIVVRSPGVMKGYYKNIEATKKVLKDGWLLTGDLGFLNENNELFIKGRIKNIIIRGGVNIYPEEIESYLLKHPLVKEVLVYGKKHDLLGEIPYAKIVPVNENLNINDIKDFAKKGLSKNKIPIIEFVNSLEHTFNKKIKR